MTEISDLQPVPAIAADPQRELERHIDPGVLARYEVASYRSAAALLASTLPDALHEISQALIAFTITTDMMKAAGGNESDIPKVLSGHLRPRGWFETELSADLIVRTTTKTGPSAPPLERRLSGYVSGHKIDYVKGRVALDLEWNSKDQTFDRDLYAMRAFHECGLLSVGVIVTRGESLNRVIAALDIRHKYGASTTWMGKLTRRLESGRNGPCPVLAVGITPMCVTDWTE